MNLTIFEELFEHVPLAVDVEAIQKEWRAASAQYDVARWQLPLPPWTKRPYDHSGDAAWEVVRHEAGCGDITQPLCIYLHVPFCDRKCGFCDSYSFKLGAHQNERLQAYVDRLCSELRLWSEQGNLHQRPVSTVHMGGGTPAFLGEAGLRQIVECCRACFNIQSDTEWALESTAQMLTPSMIATMHDLGYRRLHIGVQTLQDPVRTLIGRRNPARVVLDKIVATLSLGWVVSVDMIYGLPQQTLDGFIEDLEQLIAVGTDGISIYELLIYPQNRRWAETHGLTHRDHLPNYLAFLAGAHLLEARGFSKNLFNHWADARDANVYFTFPTRGEDLLAVGTIADGVFGNYHYRHPRYAPYLDAALPGLEGGLRRNALEERIKPLTTAILAGVIPTGLIRDLNIQTVSGETLLDKWLRSTLFTPDQNGGLALTSSGSWFAGNLVAEVTACYTHLVF